MVDRVTENTFCLKTQDGFHFLNINDMAIMTKEKFDKNYVLHYTHNIKNKINIDLI
mgnify:CR=1 FL=1